MGSIARIFVAVFLVAFSLRATPHQSSRCVGGDGPHPLLDISDQFSGETQLIPTDGAVQEFLFSEPRNNLVYRNSAEKIILHSLPSHKEQVLTTSSRPLARLRDDSGQYLTSEGAPWIFNVAKLLWHSFELAAPNIEHLFWNRGALYSVSDDRRKIPDAARETRLYRFFAGGTVSQLFCIVTGMKLAHGHQFPYVFFYRTRKTSQGELLQMNDLDVRTCHFGKSWEFVDPLAGPVREVHRFADIDATAVRVEHPTTNLLWDQGALGCRYYNVNGPSDDSSLLVLNYHRGILGSFSAKDGLQVIYPTAEKKAHILEESQIMDLRQKDVWLSNRDNRLFLAPQLQEYTGRPLLQIDLKNP